MQQATQAQIKAPVMIAMIPMARLMMKPTQPSMPSMPSIRFKELMAARSQNKVNGIDRRPRSQFQPNNVRERICTPKATTTQAAAIWPSNLCLPRKPLRSSRTHQDAQRPQRQITNPGAATVRWTTTALALAGRLDLPGHRYKRGV